MGLIDFSKKISNQLTYVPLITFAAYNESISSLLDFGLLRCILNKKKDFQIYLIKSDIVTKGIPYGDIVSINYFELNKEPEEDELLKILYKKIKQNEPYTEDIHLYSELNWSKVKLKKFIKTTDKKLLFF